MDTVVLCVGAVLAFFSGYALLLGWLGRVTFDAPRCARCNADVRPFAWGADVGRAALTCTCGANLSRSGTVRGDRQRIRRGPFVVGCVAALMLGGVIVGDISLRLSGRTWWQVLPIDVTVFALRRGSPEAAAELQRRLKIHAVSPAVAASILKRRLGGGSSDDVWDMIDALHELVFGNADVGTQFISDTCTVMAKPASAEWIPTSGSAGTYRLPLTSSAVEWGGCFVRVEDVRIDGTACAWSLADPARTRSSDAVVGRRLFVHSAILCLALAKPIPPSGAKLDIDVLIATGPYYLAVPLDPLIDSELPPPRSSPLASESVDADNAWRVNAIIARKTISVALPAPTLPAVPTAPTPPQQP